MAFGFSSKHSQVVSLSGLTPQQFIAISIEVCKTLKWKINKSSIDGMIAITRMSMSSWGEAFYVVIENEEVTLTSKCTGSQTVDWGKNFKPSILSGEWWRLITCCFLHIGIFQLLFATTFRKYGTIYNPIKSD